MQMQVPVHGRIAGKVLCDVSVNKGKHSVLLANELSELKGSTRDKSWYSPNDKILHESKEMCLLQSERPAVILIYLKHSISLLS